VKRGGRIRWLGVASALVSVVFLVNTSVLVDRDLRAVPELLAHRGMAQCFDTAGLTA